MELTKDWIEFNGDYQKEMQDIMLASGDIITMCWPNAGFWNICKKESNEKYYGKDIPVRDAVKVRLTHKDIYGIEEGPGRTEIAVSSRGFFGIGIFNGKTIENLGTLWRSADLFGAKFIYTIGRRYKKQASDTMKSYRHIPLYNYGTFGEFYNALPYDCMLAGIELHNNAVALKNFQHPERCVYLLGSEDNGLSNDIISMCHQLIQLPGRHSMNVAVAGSIVMYDRLNKQ